MNFTIKTTFYFVDESNIWTMQHQWRAARLYQGRRPFPRVFKQLLEKHWKYLIFVKSRFLLGCDRLLPLYQKTLKIHLRGPPRGGPFLLFWEVKMLTV